MPITAPLSSKLALISAQGFAFRESRQPDYRFEWHTHDCAMLLWPRLGKLKSAWMALGHDSDRAPGLADSRAARLVRGSAVLLPVCAPHLTVSDSGRQQHGELYLPPDSLHACRHFGALRLDGASPVSIRRRLLAAHARALLSEGHSLARVSERLGFATSGHLSRLLRTAGEQTR